MRVVTASLLMCLVLYGCGKDEPVSTSAVDAPAAAARDSAATAPAVAPAAQPGTADPAGGNPSGAAALPSSASSPRVSSAPSAAPAVDPKNGAAPPKTTGATGDGAASRDAAASRADTKEYTLKRGDTLASVAKAHGVDAKDLAKWNGIDNPRRLQIGQKIRLSPPGG